MTNLETFRMTIGGRPVDALSGRTFESQNPCTSAAWAVVPDYTETTSVWAELTGGTRDPFTLG